MLSTGSIANVCTWFPAASTAFRSYAMPSPLEAGVTVTVKALDTAPAANLTVALPSALVTEPPADVMTPDPGGGETPLVVFAFGSGVVLATLEGTGVLVSACVVGTTPPGATPALPPGAVPLAEPVPTTTEASGPPGVTDEPVPVVP